MVDAAHTVKLQSNSLLRLPSHSNRILAGFQCICDRLPQKQTQLTCQALAISPTKKHQNRINIFSTWKWADWLYTKFGWVYFVNYTKAIFAIRAWAKIFWLEARDTTEWHSILRNIPINGRNFVKLCLLDKFVFFIFFDSFAFKFLFRSSFCFVLNTERDSILCSSIHWTIQWIIFSLEKL